MREITFKEAIREALCEEMRRDKKVFIMGEDIGRFGGPYGVTQGMLGEFGPERVRDTPISEAGFLGAGVGAAITGLKPVAELSFADWITVCMNQIMDQMGKRSYTSAGKVKIPMVVRAAMGGGWALGPSHSQCLEALFMHVPGINLAIPSTPLDAKGLLKTAIRNEEPTVFLEHKMLYDVKGLVPQEDYVEPFGKASIRKEGEDITIVATAYMVHKAIAAAKALEKSISIEIIDPRTLVPLDKDSIINSIKKTGKLVIVHEDYKTCGMGSEIAAIAAEEAYEHLKAPIRRVATPQIPIPTSPPLEKAVIPDENKIIEAVKDITSATNHK